MLQTDHSICCEHEPAPPTEHTHCITKVYVKWKDIQKQTNQLLESYSNFKQKSHLNNYIDQETKPTVDLDYQDCDALFSEKYALIPIYAVAHVLCQWVKAKRSEV